MNQLKKKHTKNLFKEKIKKIMILMSFFDRFRKKKIEKENEEQKTETQKLADTIQAAEEEIKEKVFQRKKLQMMK